MIPELSCNVLISTAQNSSVERMMNNQGSASINTVELVVAQRTKSAVNIFNYLEFKASNLYLN